MLNLAHYKNRHSFFNKAVRLLWTICWTLFFLPTPRIKLFRFWRVFLLKCFGAKIQWSSNVLPSCRIWYPKNLTMGSYATLAENVDCYNVDQIILGDQAVVSKDSFLCTASHDITSPVMELTSAPIILQPQSWVCARSTVLPGVTVGMGAIVAAGAVVSKDVEPWMVVGGNPAQKIKRRVLRDE